MLIVMFVGECAGSAGGGIKVFLIHFMGKYLKRGPTQILHPRAVFPIKVDKSTVSNDIQYQVIGLLLFYLTLFFLLGPLVTMFEGDLVTGFLGTAATLGNIGPDFDEIGPKGTFGSLTVPTKTVF